MYSYTLIRTHACTYIYIDWVMNTHTQTHRHTHTYIYIYINRGIYPYMT